MSAKNEVPLSSKRSTRRNCPAIFCKDSEIAETRVTTIIRRSRFGRWHVAKSKVLPELVWVKVMLFGVNELWVTLFSVWAIPWGKWLWLRRLPPTVIKWWSRSADESMLLFICITEATNSQSLRPWWCLSSLVLTFFTLHMLADHDSRPHHP